MRAETAARAIGWASLGFTAFSVVAPDAMGRLFGVGQRRGLVRALGGRDLAVGAGLVLARDPAPWLRARLVSDVADAALHAGGALAERFDPRRALTIAAGATALALLDAALLRRLPRA